MLLLTNHIGYERLGPKKAIIQTSRSRLVFLYALYWFVPIAIRRLLS